MQPDSLGFRYCFLCDLCFATSGTAIGSWRGVTHDARNTRVCVLQAWIQKMRNTRKYRSLENTAAKEEHWKCRCLMLTTRGGILLSQKECYVWDRSKPVAPTELGLPPFLQAKPKHFNCAPFYLFCVCVGWGGGFDETSGV